MTTEATLITQLAEAQTKSLQNVDALPYAALDRGAAYRVQTGVLAAVGATVGMLKTAVHPDGVGVAAPIYGTRVGQSGNFALPAATLTGLEVEVGLVLARDLPQDVALADEVEIVEAISHYFVGVEICGTRFRDRSVSGPMGGLADNMSAFGYVIDPSERDSGADIDNFDVELSLAGKPIYGAPAKHGFGSVLASFVAYAKAQHPAYPLKAGTIITTGSLCGLVPFSGTGRVEARLGVHSVTFEIV